MGIFKKKQEAPKSIVKNEPHLKNPLLQAIREQLEHRALWMYVLVTEAEKHGLDPDLTEQIVRLYVTHPGVTVDGIMTKLGLLGKL